jgi:hypothetical protein
VIDSYLGALGARLRGPARLKADLLAEARDGLRDAARVHLDAGLDPAAAQLRAVRDFGDLGVVAPAFQAELSAADGRRTALLILLVLGPQPLLWNVADAVSGTGAPAPAYPVVDALLGWFGGAALVLALGAAAAAGVGARWLRDPGQVARLTGGFAVAVAVVFVVTGTVMVALGPMDAWSVTGVPLFATALVAPMALVAVWGWRCVRGGRAAGRRIGTGDVRPGPAAAR